MAKKRVLGWEWEDFQLFNSFIKTEAKETSTSEEYVDALADGYVNAKAPYKIVKDENPFGEVKEIKQEIYLEETYELLRKRKDESPFITLEYAERTIHTIGCTGMWARMKMEECLQEIVTMMDAGFHPAIISLAFFFRFGLQHEGIRVLKVSNRLYVKALRYGVKKGCAEAKYFLAECYENGMGVFKNKKKAAKLYESAFVDGYEDAKKGLQRLSEYVEDPRLLF